MSELKVKYVGNDLEYFKDLKKAFKSFQSLSPVFLSEPIDEGFHAPEAFVKTYDERCDIVYVDLSERQEKGLSLCKLLCRNNITRAKSVVALHEKKKGTQSLLKSALAGVRLSYFKGIELEDVVFHPLSLLDSSLRPAMTYAEGASLGRFSYKQILRVGYIADDHFRVETNSPVELEEIIELENHPLDEVMKCRRFYVQNFSDSDLYYNQRFSYELKFTFIDNDFFRASENSWIEYERNKTGTKISEARKARLERFVIPDIEKRSKDLLPVHREVKEWLKQNRSSRAPKRLKVLVIDETLEIFKEYDGNLDSFNYTINFQTHLTSDFYQIRRSRPHLILFHFEEEGNNGEVLSQVVEQVKKLKDYEPVILVFNCQDSCDSSEELQKQNSYEHIISYKEKVDLEIIQIMSGIMDERFHITDPEGKVFLQTSDPRSVALLKRQDKILKFNESELYFESRYEIPMWTVFIMQEPLSAFITVLPMGSHSPRLKSSKTVYRALIHGVGEQEKAELRRLVNESLDTFGKEKS